ncbi:MAG: M48 family metallopeptidase [Acidiferrobacterales bacterium]
MNNLTILFLATLLLVVCTQVWLARRQIRHVEVNRSAVPEPFREKIAPKTHKKAANYTIAKTRFSIVDYVVSALLLVIWTLGGGLQALDDLWRNLDWGVLATGTAFMVSVALIMGLLDLPASIYQTFVIEQRFGFNRMTPGLFLIDLIKKALLVVAIGVPLILAALWLMQEMGEWWWLYVWVLWTAFSLVATWAFPTLIAPLFNTFTPLQPGPVKERIQSLLERTGFSTHGIYAMDGSRRSTHGNAYFSGFGKSKRIVFFDSLLDSLADSEIEAVLAHELGHFKCRHVTKRLLLSFALSLCGLALLGWLIKQSWFYAGLGISQPSTYTALTLFILVAPVFTFFLQPLFAWGSRKHEFEADIFAAKHSDARELASALIKLYEENASTLTPDPVHSAFYDSHPPAPVRIAHLKSMIVT